ncbi:MAG TPA: hypothetical protein VFR55_03900 [Dehalococcoidia bacterium]|nr:hypothetical protein [Dehalococcoidia bacterium]
MQAPSRLLAQTGIAVAVAAAILGVSVLPASAFNFPEVPGRLSEPGLGRPSPDEPIETQIEQAIEEVAQEGQDALEELGDLDTPEKVDRAEEILQHMGVTSYEIRKRSHDSAADRFDELNDLAIGRLGDEARAELSDVGGADTPEKRDRAEAIRARIAVKRAQLEARWDNQNRRMAQRRSELELPRADFRRPNGRPPLFAAAYGLRLRLENLTEEQANEAIDQLERDAQTASEGLGEVDTPGKAQRAQKMRATLAERLQDLRRRVANQNWDAAGEPGMAQELDHADDQLEERARELQQRAEAAINGLGELNTPEKQDQARQINARLETALAALRERRSNATDEAFQERLDRETRSLQRRTDAALEELGELDTPEKQEKARRIRVRLAEKVQKLREQLARHSGAAFNAEFVQESDGLRMDTVVALQELGRLDTPEKVLEARLIRVRMQEAINRLRNQRAHQLNDNKSGRRSEVLTDFLDNRGRGDAGARMTDPMDGNISAEPRDRAEQARQAQQKAINALHQQRDKQSKTEAREAKMEAEQERARARTRARQAITPDPDWPRPEPDREAEPTVTPESGEVEPAGNDSTSDSDSSGSEGGRNQ